MPETPTVGRPDPPPPPPAVMFAGFALAFQVATVIVLVSDRGDLAMIMGILALVFSAATFFLLLGRGRADYASSSRAEDEPVAETRRPGTTRDVPGGPQAPAGS